MTNNPLSSSMLDPNMLLAEVRTLENKIRLSQQLPNNSPTPANPYGLNRDLLTNSINDLVEQKLAAMGLVRNSANQEQAATAQAPAPTVEQPLSPQAILEKKINDFATSVLSGEQLEWISNPTIFSGIPLFLTSNKGKELITMMVDDYKVFLDR